MNTLIHKLQFSNILSYSARAVVRAMACILDFIIKQEERIDRCQSETTFQHAGFFTANGLDFNLIKFFRFHVFLFLIFMKNV